MLRAKSWIVSPLALALVLVIAVRPEARTRDVQGVLSSAPVAPEVLQIEGCTTVGQREEYELQDCLQSTRLALMNGEIGLDEALTRLEACAGERVDLAPLAERSARLRADLLRARLAFGETLFPEEQEQYAAFALRFEGLETPPPAAAVRRLRAAGITTGRIAEDREEEVLRRLREDGALRADFRAVFGDLRADDLERLLDETPERTATAVVLGATTIIPNLPPASPTPEGTLSVEAEPVARALVVSTDAYVARFVSDLRALELGRLQYLTSAGLLNQEKGSVRAFLERLRSFGDDEAREQELREAVRRDQAVLAARLMNLDRRLGLDPLLARMAGESVGLATQISRTCEEVAANRQRWIHIGTGVVTGLVGAAGVVVATGATGSLLGGVTIAAALEASIGAYLIAKTERIGEAIASAAPPARIIEELRAELRTVERPEAETGVMEEGEEGEGGSALDTWLEEFDEARELAFVEGESADEEEDGERGEEVEEETPKNTIPPILPIDIPEELRELPPFLDTREMRALRELTLPEIQQRLDEFLVGTDPATWARLVEEEEVELWPTAMMIQEAQAALNLWEHYRQLSDRFGTFFIQAELERLPAERRSQVLTQAMGRYLRDRAYYEDSRDIADLRRRIASRLVTHCRAGASPGDLVLAACVDETALTLLVVAAIRDANLPVPNGTVLGVQAFDGRFEAVLYSRSENRVFSLTRGAETEGVVAPIYHPAVFYYGYLLDHQVVPTIDIDKHLLVALPDRPMPPEMEMEECVVEEGRGVLDRAVQWIGSMFGIRKVSDDPCAEGDAERARRSGRNGADGGVNLSLPAPRNPLQRGGGGQAGGGGGGGGGGGSSSPLSPNSPGDPLSGGGSTDLSPESGGQGGEGGSGQGQRGSSSGDGGEAGGSGGAGDGRAADDGAAGTEGRGGQQPGSGENAAAAGEQAQGGGDGSGAGGEAANAGSGGDGGYGIGSLPAGPSLTRIGRETARMSQRHEQAPDLRVVPWRLREDQGMATGSPSAVLYADNARALERFDEDDLFITLAPAEVEAQRRMLEADSYPIYPADATCETASLPPRRVFRRAAANEAGFRYVFCDHDESMVIFREQKDAQSYARLSPPDRPLFLARLASERLARFERSEDIARLQAFLSDPNVLRNYSRDQIAATVKAAADLLVFQDALESALVQSMNELGPSALRSHYYELHRQVFQAPFFLDLAEKVYRLNQRLASDPLQSLAWANAQEPRVRQGFFELYFTVGAMMDWPRRWATLQSRYGDSQPPMPDDDPKTSLDFLQILSDPTRVRIAWDTERDGSPSIRDTRAMEGVERSPEEPERPTQSDKLDKQDEEKHLRGGTAGLGRAGTGDSRGPDSGRRPPLQMIRIRITPDAEGDPRGEDFPRANALRPGGTEGRERRQTEESASRQDPVLWVTPQTFVEAVLSTWDSRDLRPESASRVPPLLRFNERLRELFLREFHPSNGIYDNRLRAAMELFTRWGWLRFAEVREVMGGPLVTVKAFDAGRFSGAYSGNAPINDQDQIRIPNFFSREGVIIPADLFRPVREHYTRSVLGIFDLAAEQRVPSAESLENLPIPPGEGAAAARANLLRNLELIRQEADGD